MEENKNLVLEAIKSLITEEQIDDAIRVIVADRMNYSIEREIVGEAKRIAREYCDRKIEDTLADIFGRQVNLDDCFGNRRGYKTFEEYVREYVGTQCKQQWNLERKVQDMVKKRVEEVCKKVVAENEANLADKAMKIIAGETEQEKENGRNN